MSPRVALVFSLAASVTGCKSDTDDTVPPPAPVGSGSGSAKSNFGAELNADLAGTAAPAGSAKAAAGSAASGSGVATSGSGSGAAASGSAVAASGSGSAVAASGSGVAASGSGSVVAASGSGTRPAVAASGSGTPPAVPATGSGPLKPIPVPVPATGSGSAATATAPPQSTAPRVPAKVSPELAAIKLSLQPNWDRDIGDPATISLSVKRPSGDPAIFSFTYGYDDPRAPADRDAYIHFLGDQKLLTVAVNRQRGSAWYLEGTDANGPAFRYLVNYGGKHLVCYGSLYKDAASSGMGDIRDEVINQAKKICETLAL